MGIASHDIPLMMDNLHMMHQLADKDIEVEIKDHLERRCLSELKAIYTQKMNILIQPIRKQLQLKSVKYLNLLVELLGETSNLITTVIKDISLTPLQYPIVLGINERAMETMILIIKSYSSDRNIDTWLHRIQRSESLNLLTLDTIIQTIAQILNLISNYQTFLMKKFPNHTPLDSERNQIRELESNYISLEYGYLTSTLVEAMESQSLLEIEPEVFTSQCIEDSFFLLSKIVDRSLFSHSEYILIGILSKIIEVLDPSRDSRIYLLLHDQLHLDKTSIQQDRSLPITAVPSSSSLQEINKEPSPTTSPFGYLSHFGKAVALASGAMVEEDLSVDTVNKIESRASSKWLQTSDTNLNSLLVEVLDIQAYIHSDPEHIRLPMEETSIYLNSLMIAASTIVSLLDEIETSTESQETAPQGEVVRTLLQVQ